MDIALIGLAKQLAQRDPLAVRQAGEGLHGKAAECYYRALLHRNGKWPESIRQPGEDDGLV